MEQVGQFRSLDGPEMTEADLLDEGACRLYGLNATAGQAMIVAGSLVSNPFLSDSLDHAGSLYD
jgi:hypothetical protein